MDIEEKLAKYRQSKSIEEKQNTEKCKESSSNFFTKFFASRKPTEQKEIKEECKNNLKPTLAKRRSQANDHESNGLVINEIEEEVEEEPEEYRVKVLRFVLKFLLWAILYALFIKLEFGVVYFVCSLLVLIYLNTNVRKRSKLSAYSVFNPNLERIHGTLTAEQLEKNLIKPF